MSDWVRDRKKFGAGPPIQYSFSEKKEASDDPETPGSGDVFPDAGAEVSIESDSDAEISEVNGSDSELSETSGSFEGISETSGSDVELSETRGSDAGISDSTASGHVSESSGHDSIVSGRVSTVSGHVSAAARTRLIKSADSIKKSLTKERIELIRLILRTAIAGFFAILFLMPIILTITNSFMTSSEISANYGMIFKKSSGVRVFISKTVNLKFIPDVISFDQYFKVLFLSPEYLMKFWNSFFYVVPIVVFQLGIASLASYGFARYRGKVREIIFFSYIILMLMPYQVTLVPNYLVSTWLNIIDTRWAILLPGFFSPFAVYMLTKYMRRIPRSIYEAAEIDGAGEWQIFTGVCLPNCRGGLVSIAILIFIDYWNMVEQPLILLSDDQLHPLSVFLSRINSGEISLAFAVAVIYMVLPMMVFLYGEDYLVEGIIYQGGIKE